MLSALTQRARRTTLRLYARALRGLYLQRERAWAHFTNPRPLSILVSNHYEAWQDAIRGGFAGSPHAISFGALDDAALETFDLIVPLSLADARFLRTQRESVRARAVATPSDSLSALCHDKPRLNQWLIDAGLGRHVPAMGQAVPPPFVCKPVHGENSRDCHLVPDADAYERLRDVVDRPGMFRQAAVRGRVEYATHFLARTGRIERSLTVAYHHEADVYIKGRHPADATGEERASERSITACPDPDALGAIVGALAYDGLGCANYKVAGGCLQLLEINPRFGGSLAPYFFSFLRSLPQGRDAREARMGELAIGNKLASQSSRY
jgi:hypothetical protein